MGMLLFVLSAMSFSARAATYYSVSGAINWNSLASWRVAPAMTVATSLPTENDDIIIGVGSVITVPSNYTAATAKSITISGTIKIESGSRLILKGNVTVENGGNLSLDTNGNDAGYLVVYGNYSNFGTTNIGKGNIIVALDYYDANVTIQNLGNLVVGGEFTAKINTNGTPSIYVLNPNVTPVITPSTVTYTTNPPTGENPTLISIVTNVITDPTCNISIAGPYNANNVCSGQNVTFTAVPSPLGTYTYRWQLSTGGEFTDVPGATSSTLTLFNVSSGMNNYKYRCKVTSSGASSCTKTSAYATLTVSPSVTVAVAITASSNNQCEGTEITFLSTVTNGGTLPGYQWLVNSTDKNTNSPSYKYTPLNGDKVQLKVTSNVTCAANPGSSNVIEMVIYDTPDSNPIVAN